MSKEFFSIRETKKIKCFFIKNFSNQYLSRGKNSWFEEINIVNKYCKTAGKIIQKFRDRCYQ